MWLHSEIMLFTRKVHQNLPKGNNSEGTLVQMYLNPMIMSAKTSIDYEKWS